MSDLNFEIKSERIVFGVEGQSLNFETAENEVAFETNGAETETASIQEEEFEFTSDLAYGGGGGTIIVSNDYNEMINKPKIEGVTLQGDKTFPELSLNVLTNTELEQMLK